VSEHYACPEDFVLRHGEVWTPQPLPSAYSPGVPKRCFLNAALLVAGSEGLRYVEGYAVSDGVGLPIHHAWAVDAEGRVVDPTWSVIGDAYLGVVFDIDRLPGPGSSMLDDWVNGWPLLQTPFAP
jgi:hypothetical protein